MADIILHPGTAATLARLTERLPHAVLLTGPAGSGKLTVARYLSSKYLKIPEERLDTYPHYLVLHSEDGRALSIDAVRSMQRQLVLKIPGAGGIARIVVIEDAHLLTVEAQNALLKTLEEPPLDTALILTATAQDSLLPTIQSRVHTVPVAQPPADDLAAALQKRRYDQEAIDTALVLSGNLPGLTLALLDDDTAHPLHQATVEARKLLQSRVYERLLLVDSLSKQKSLCQDIVFVLGQMARTALERSRQSTNPASVTRWQGILKAAYEADAQLRANTQAKLVMTNLMFAL